MTKPVTQDLTDEEIQSLIDDVVDAYGVDDSDVTVETSYDVSGNMTLNIPETLEDANSLEVFLEENLAEILGVDPSNVEVRTVTLKHAVSVEVLVDPTTGEVTYTIKSDTFEDAANVQASASDPLTMEELNERLADAFPGVEITDNQVDEDIVADVDITVDTDDATKDAEEAR